jgi:hypothetical protein
MNLDMKDPIQGFDVDVSIQKYDTGGSISQILVGRFTSILVRVVNVTETYLELNQRMPRHLDGEINIVWQCERGMLNTQVLQETFGFFGTSNSIGRNNDRIQRARRFTIDFSVKVNNSDFVDENMRTYNAQLQTNTPITTYRLHLCKTDTMSFGATSGRNIVANQWQGTAEGIELRSGT